MSVNPSATNITPGNTFQMNNLIASTINYTSAASTFSYTFPGLTSTSVALATYEHPGGGGAAQFITYITPGTNQLNIGYGQNTANGESVNILAIKTALATNPQ